MDIKELKKGQSAYMLKENYGYNKGPELMKVTVLSVGEKYVTVIGDGDIRFKKFFEDDNYLKECEDCGDQRLLFKDKKTATDHLKRMELDTWLYENEPKMHQLSVPQLQAIRKIVEEPEQKTVV